MITVKKLKWTDVENEYKNVYTKRKYRCLLKEFISVLKMRPTCLIDGKDYATFSEQKDWDNFVRDYCDSFEKESMKFNAYTAVCSLIKHFYMPQIAHLGFRWESGHHKGFNNGQRKIIINYCLSDQDDNDRLMCIIKFMTITLLDTGVRCFELNKVIKEMVNSPKITKLIETADIANMSINEMLELPSFTDVKITIHGKRSTCREISVSPRMIKLWKKVCQHGQENKWNISCEQTRERLKKILTKLNIAGTTHDFRVCFATDYYAKTHDLLALSRLMGHKRIEQTIAYVRLYNEDDQTVKIISDERNISEHNHATQLAKLEKKVDELQSTIKELNAKIVVRSPFKIINGNRYTDNNMFFLTSFWWPKSA